MKDRQLMTFFFSGHAVDSVVSHFAFLNGFSEIGFLKDSPYISSLDLSDRLIMAKMGIVVLMTGAYALAKQTDNKRLSFVTERTLLIGGIAVWGVQMWNILNVVAEAINK